MSNQSKEAIVHIGSPGLQQPELSLLYAQSLRVALDLKLTYQQQKQEKEDLAGAVAVSRSNHIGEDTAQAQLDVLDPYSAYGHLYARYIELWTMGKYQERDSLGLVVQALREKAMPQV